MNSNATNNGGHDPGMAKNTVPVPFGPAQNGPLWAPQAPQNAIQQSHGAETGFQAPGMTDRHQPVQPHASAELRNDVSGTTPVNIPQESPNIEVEWVERVERIVTGTTGDPYAKSHQLTLLKSEYVKKMYGKTIGQDGQK